LTTRSQSENDHNVATTIISTATKSGCYLEEKLLTVLRIVVQHRLSHQPHLTALFTACDDAGYPHDVVISDSDQRHVHQLSFSPQWRLLRETFFHPQIVPPPPQTACNKEVFTARRRAIQPMDTWMYSRQRILDLIDDLSREDTVWFQENLDEPDEEDEEDDEDDEATHSDIGIDPGWTFSQEYLEVYDRETLSLRSLIEKNLDFRMDSKSELSSEGLEELLDVYVQEQTEYVYYQVGTVMKFLSRSELCSYQHWLPHSIHDADRSKIGQVVMNVLCLSELHLRRLPVLFLRKVQSLYEAMMHTTCQQLNHLEGSSLTDRERLQKLVTLVEEQDKTFEILQSIENSIIGFFALCDMIAIVKEELQYLLQRGETLSPIAIEGIPQDWLELALNQEPDRTLYNLLLLLRNQVFKVRQFMEFNEENSFCFEFIAQYFTASTNLDEFIEVHETQDLYERFHYPNGYCNVFYPKETAVEDFAPLRVNKIIGCEIVPIAERMRDRLYIPRDPIVLLETPSLLQSIQFLFFHCLADLYQPPDEVRYRMQEMILLDHARSHLSPEIESYAPVLGLGQCILATIRMMNKLSREKLISFQGFVSMVEYFMHHYAGECDQILLEQESTNSLAFHNTFPQTLQALRTFTCIDCPCASPWNGLHSKSSRTARHMVAVVCRYCLELSILWISTKLTCIHHDREVLKECLHIIITKWTDYLDVEVITTTTEVGQPHAMQFAFEDVDWITRRYAMLQLLIATLADIDHEMEEKVGLSVSAWMFISQQRNKKVMVESANETSFSVEALPTYLKDIVYTITRPHQPLASNGEDVAFLTTICNRDDWHRRLYSCIPTSVHQFRCLWQRWYAADITLTLAMSQLETNTCLLTCRALRDSRWHVQWKETHNLLQLWFQCISSYINAALPLIRPERDRTTLLYCVMLAQIGLYLAEALRVQTNLLLKQQLNPSSTLRDDAESLHLFNLLVLLQRMTNTATIVDAVVPVMQTDDADELKLSVCTCLEDSIRDVNEVMARYASAYTSSDQCYRLKCMETEDHSDDCNHCLSDIASACDDCMDRLIPVQETLIEGDLLHSIVVRLKHNSTSIEHRSFAAILLCAHVIFQRQEAVNVFWYHRLARLATSPCKMYRYDDEYEKELAISEVFAELMREWTGLLTDVYATGEDDTRLVAMQHAIRPLLPSLMKSFYRAMREFKLLLKETFTERELMCRHIEPHYVGGSVNQCVMLIQLLRAVLAWKDSSLDPMKLGRVSEFETRLSTIAAESSVLLHKHITNGPTLQPVSSHIKRYTSLKNGSMAWQYSYEGIYCILIP
jgi:hypothetical protein